MPRPDNDHMGNHSGDNLADDPDDDIDGNECFNWVNHPIRAMFDPPPKTPWHKSGLQRYQQNSRDSDEDS